MKGERQMTGDPLLSLFGLALPQHFCRRRLQFSKQLENSYKKMAPHGLDGLEDQIIPFPDMMTIERYTLEPGRAPRVRIPETLSRRNIRVVSRSCLPKHSALGDARCPIAQNNDSKAPTAGRQSNPGVA